MTALAEQLGKAAAHERAAGELGSYLKNDQLNSHDGEDIQQDLPDRQEVTPHFNAYITMIQETGAWANDHVPQLSYRGQLPDEPIDEESALLAGYVLERQAREYAADAIDTARGTEYEFLIHGSGETVQFSLSDIQREENEEMREIEDTLVEDDEYGVDSRDELRNTYETLDDVDALAG
jgi:hypothetical protein